jgi:hypothetical protein
VFDGWSWVADDSAPAACPVSADCLSVWIPEPEPPQPQVAPPCVCELVWPVVPELPAVACEPAVLDCVTEPSLPGLRTRTGTFVLLAPSCAAVLSAPASWSVADCCCDV